MGAISAKKVILHVVAISTGISVAIYIPLDNKDVIGWIIGAFTAFGGILLAVRTLAGHSLALLQGENWKSLQEFKETFSARILFNAFISFLLILTVILFLIQTIFPYYYIKKLTQFFTGVCLVYVLSLPFSLSKMYVDYYIFSIKKAKQCKNTSEQTADTSKSQPPSG